MTKLKSRVPFAWELPSRSFRGGGMSRRDLRRQMRHCQRRSKAWASLSLDFTNTGFEGFVLDECAINALNWDRLAWEAARLIGVQSRAPVVQVV